MSEIARVLKLAGRWDLALTVTDEPGLGAEILVDRHAWRIDDPAQARAAVEALQDKGLAALLRGQLNYWAYMFKLADVSPDQIEADLTAALDEHEPWATFFLGVVADNVRQQREVAAERFDRAEELAKATGDRLLESYTVRHRGAVVGDVELMRLSLRLRAALGAVPQVAAAQAALAEFLPDGMEKAGLQEVALVTAKELGLTWLRKGLESS